MFAKDSLRHRDERLAQEPRIASYDHSCSARLLRKHILRDPTHRAADIGQRKIIGHHTTPSRGSKFDLCHSAFRVEICCHGSLDGVTFDAPKILLRADSK